MISNDALLGLPEAVLGASWAGFGVSWAVSGGSPSPAGRPFWAVWVPLGSFLGCAGAPRGRLGHCEDDTRENV
eukprot:4754251-Pyramimonas_sp.AAC.1